MKDIGKAIAYFDPNSSINNVSGYNRNGARNNKFSNNVCY